MKLIYPLLVTILISFSACSLLKLNEDLEKLNKLVTVNGKVILETDHNSSVMIVMMKDEKPFFKTVDYIHKKSAGEFTFTEEVGKYYIYAWADINNNAKYETNEAISKCFVNLQEGDSSTQECQITIAHTSKRKELQIINHITKTQVDDIAITHNLGTITSLENSRFNKENANKGLWEPYSFIEEVPSGLFLLEKYNPNKKVLLFIHGMNGTPQNFKHIIDGLDITNYQVMLFYYPSGLRLSEIANYLDYLMQEFQIKHQIKDISLIAHSMGGLMRKEYINIQLNI